MNIESVSSVGVTTRTAPNDSVQQGARPSMNSPTAPQTASEQRNSAPTAVKGEQGSTPSRQTVDEAVSRLAKFVSPNQADINFSVDESSGIRVVKIIDRNSNEVIRQMPSEEAVALAQALDKLQGLLIRDKA